MDEHEVVYSGMGSISNLGEGDSSYVANFYTQEESKVFFENISSFIEEDFEDPEKMKFPIFGRENLLPRGKAFYADSIIHNGVKEYPLYDYSGGKEVIPHDWRPILAEIRDKITSFTGQRPTLSSQQL